MRTRRPRLSASICRFAWCFGFPIVYYAVSMALYHLIWHTGWLDTNGSGLPTIFGHDLAYYVCGPAPLLCAVVVALALNGKLPGTQSQAIPPYHCERCGYDLRGSLAEIRNEPCPECGARQEPVGES